MVSWLPQLFFRKHQGRNPKGGPQANLIKAITKQRLCLFFSGEARLGPVDSQC